MNNKVIKELDCLLERGVSKSTGKEYYIINVYYNKYRVGSIFPDYKDLFILGIQPNLPDMDD